MSINNENQMREADNVESMRREPIFTYTLKTDDGERTAVEMWAETDPKNDTKELRVRPKIRY